MRTDERIGRALAARDGAAIAGLAEQGVDLGDIAVDTVAGARTLLDEVLRLGDVELLRAVLAAPGISAARGLPDHGYWEWAQDAPLPVIREFLVAPGADLAHADADGYTILHEVAAGRADPAVLGWLAGRMPADPVAANGTTPFFAAAVHGHLEAASVLLRAGADPNAVNRDTGWTALTTAVVAGRDDLVRGLLAFDGVDVNHADAEGATALHHAARLGLGSTVELLVSRPGTDPSLVDDLGRTAVMDAALRGHTAVVDVLRRADPDAPVDAPPPPPPVDDLPEPNPVPPIADPPPGAP
ncbi:ankyrin repeat domain-containing protein [Amycolatopsis vancoresmycina]|uniref:Ankyrin n=1 Tax=Amycolatopsis vancoresmycina DSM 44592 TaxID=1292037 RepID=R1HJR8_9PSEU|nr:ankyrin repeat domain-containing protein [Amycolatopsis vancoresmycina]EOD60591.1 ankyrin [Amycolatopsis vancoresmycina DSM 44592]